ncbi:MAG: hypothetical protein B6244_12565 [Candidatus Cloacimonetes bacterium 4572_55]|nr:MAG: hypothetical protein B6244_12565 [Candidatus Cloacimonetes bacterium 4572_55]
MTQPRRENFTRIGSLFEDYFRQIGMFQRYKQGQVLAYWEEVVGERVARHTTPTSCRDRILFVEVDSPTWMNELQYRKRDIVTQINRFLNGSFIKDIRFVAPRG